MKKIPQLLDWSALNGTMNKKAGQAVDMVRKQLEDIAEAASAAARLLHLMEENQELIVYYHLAPFHKDLIEFAQHLQSKAVPADSIEVDVEPQGEMQVGFDGQDGSRMIGDMGPSGNMTTAFDPETKTSRSTSETHIASKGAKGKGKAQPTKPSLWSRAKSEAKKKFDVWPSAYANGWAAKWYKKHGGGWKD